MENGKVSDIASRISKCCNNRVMCKQGNEQCWAKKEKSQTKDWFWFITNDGLVIDKRTSRLAAALQELAMCVFGAASFCEKSLVVF